MATSIGQIGLDLVVNEGSFRTQMSGIQNLAKKAGAALAGAFAVKKLVDFGIRTIGELAREKESTIQTLLGEKNGHQLYQYARGIDESPVLEVPEESKGLV